MTEQMYRNHYAPLQLPAPGPHYSDPEYPDVDVAIMESTYPLPQGWGVRGGARDIVCENPDLTYGIIHIAWDKNSPHEDLYGMPENVKWVKVLYLEPGSQPRRLRGSLRPLRTAHELCGASGAHPALMDGFSAYRWRREPSGSLPHDEGTPTPQPAATTSAPSELREFMQAIAGLGFFSEVPR